MGRHSRIELKFVTRNVDRHGNVRFYYRRNGRYLRLRGLPGSEEFMAAYKAALAGDGGGKAEKSLDWLITQYFSSPEVRAMEESTKRLKRRSLDEVRDTPIANGKRVGSLPFKGMRREHVVALRDRKADTPEAANKRVKNLAALFAWAIQAGHASVNPAWKVGKLQSGNPGGFYTWTESDVDAFEAQWPVGSRQHLAMSLMLYLGVRVSDAIRLGPKCVSKDGSAITFEVWKGRKKSAKVLTLPILQPLRSALKAADITGATYLLTEAGKPWSSVNSFGNWFRKACRAAQLPTVFLRLPPRAALRPEQHRMS